MNIKLFLDLEYHTNAPGPLRNPAAAQDELAMWLASLTNEDALQLLSWARIPTLPEGVPDRPLALINDLRLSACYHAAEIGAATQDERVRRSLVDLLAVAECRSTALDVLESFATADLVDQLRPHAASSDLAILYSFGKLLVAIDTPEARQLLTDMHAERAGRRREQQSLEIAAPLLANTD